MKIPELGHMIKLAAGELENAVFSWGHLPI